MGCNETTWEPIENLFNAMELVTAFIAEKQRKSKGESSECIGRLIKRKKGTNK